MGSRSLVAALLLALLSVAASTGDGLTFDVISIDRLVDAEELEEGDAQFEVKDEGDIREGITYCGLRDNNDGGNATWCPARTTPVTQGEIGKRDVLQEGGTGLVVDITFLLRLPDGASYDSFNCLIESNDTALVVPDEVRISEAWDISDAVEGQLYNITLDVPVQPDDVGVVQLNVTLDNNAGLSYNSTVNIHVLGIVVTGIAGGVANFTDGTVMFESVEQRNDNPVVALNAKLFTYSSVPRDATFPTAEDVVFDPDPQTNGGQVTLANNCPYDVTVENGDGTFDLRSGCGVGFTADGNFIGIRYNENRVGDDGVLMVFITVPDITIAKPETGAVTVDAVYELETVTGGWEAAAPVVQTVTVEPLQPVEIYGGNTITLEGFNMPTTDAFSYSMTLFNNNVSVPAFEAMRFPVEGSAEQGLTFVTTMITDEAATEVPLNIMITKIHESATTNETIEDTVTYGSLYKAPEGKSRVTVLFQIENLNLVNYYLRARVLLETLASIGGEVFFETSFPLTVTETDPTGAVRTLATMSRQDDSENTEETTSVFVENIYYVAPGREQDVQENIEQAIERNVFVAETGHSLGRVTFQPQSDDRVEDAEIASNVAIVATVAVVISFIVGGQTATVISGLEATAQVTEVVTPLNIASTSSTNSVMKVISPVQILSGRGLVNVGVTEPYISAAAQTSGYMLRVPPPWDRGTETATERFTTRQTLTVQNFYDAVGDTDFQQVFAGQLFYISLSVFAAMAIHVTLHLALRNRHKRAHRVCMRILTKLEVMYLNLLHLGIIISVSEILSNPESNVYFVLAAVLVLFIFGLGYPALVIYVLVTSVWPRLNKEWLSRSYRSLLGSSWFCFWRKRDYSDEHEDVDVLWVQDEDFAYVAKRHRRFSGRWQAEGPRDDTNSMFGTFFMAYKGQFFFYFLVEILILALVGIVMGALQFDGKLQAVLILALEVLALVLLVWLAPFNDYAENILNAIMLVINVAIGSIQVVLADPMAENEAVRLSRIMLILNLVIIFLSILFVLYSIAEGIWFSGASLQGLTDFLCCRMQFVEDDEISSMESYPGTASVYYVERDRKEYSDPYTEEWVSERPAGPTVLTSVDALRQVQDMQRAVVMM